MNSMNKDTQELAGASQRGKEQFYTLVRKVLAKYLPAKIPLHQNLHTTDLGEWEPGTNYVITDNRISCLTLADNFASHGGHMIWVGVTGDLVRMCEELMFYVAGIEHKAPGIQIQFDAMAQCKLAHAHERIAKMWIDFCNVDDCGEIDVEQKFLAAMSSFKPTLIVVDESIFDESSLNSFDALVRQTHALRMIEELRATNPMNSVLWHLPEATDLDRFGEAAIILSPDNRSGKASAGGC